MAPFPTVPVERCPFCESDNPLRAESHIIPAFVYDYLIETSATGFLRSSPAPNLRIQDGFKQRLLCDACEGLLSGFEGETARSLFRPYHADTAAVMPYGPWLGKFCASLCWRVLYILQRLGLNHLTESQHLLVPQALSAWREIVHGRSANTAEFELHLIPMDMLEAVIGTMWPPNMSRYLARAVEMDVGATDNSAFVYAKLCKLVVVGSIQMKYPQEWINTRVSMTEGVVKPEDRGLPTNFGLYLGDRARKMAELLDSMSRKQKDRVWETTKDKVDRAANSDTFRAVQQDVAVFGRAAFAADPDDPDKKK